MTTIDQLPERYRSKVVECADGCWHWVGSRQNLGYGVTKVNGRQSYAHRVIYELLVGPIPEGLQIDHKCRVKHCVRPDHLEPVTGQENTLRAPNAPAAINAQKTHCPQDHEYTPENTRIKRGSRHCITCARAYDHARVPQRRIRRALKRAAA